MLRGLTKCSSLHLTAVGRTPRLAALGRLSQPPDHATRYRSIALCTSPPSDTELPKRSRVRHFSNDITSSTCGEAYDPLAQQKRDVTMLGMYANVGLAVAKSGVGFVSGSVSLLADGLHSLSDLASDVVTLGILRITSKPADSKYPWGYGRFDALGTLFVASLLVGGSCAIGFNSLEVLLATVGSTDGSSDVADGLRYAGPALGVAAASVLVKELLYRKTLTVGKEARSNVLVANAWHHRSDALSSVIAMAGIAGAMANVPELDTFGGILVSGMILRAGVGMGWDAIKELSDASVQREVVDRIREMTARLKESPQEDIFGVHNVRARRMGHYTIVDLHVEVDPQLSISMAYAAAARLRERVISEIPEVIDVSTHLEPYNPKEHARVHSSRIDRLRRGDGSSKNEHGPGHSWFSEDGLHTGAKSEKSQAELTFELRGRIEALPLKVKVTHLTCHKIDDHLTAEITIALADESLSIAEARMLANTARQQILEGTEGVDDVDLHLEL